jgi:hypothetical protein
MIMCKLNLSFWEKDVSQSEWSENLHTSYQFRPVHQIMIYKSWEKKFSPPQWSPFKWKKFWLNVNFLKLLPRMKTHFFLIPRTILYINNAGTSQNPEWSLFKVISPYIITDKLINKTKVSLTDIKCWDDTRCEKTSIREHFFHDR